MGQDGQEETDLQKTVRALQLATTLKGPGADEPPATPSYQPYHSIKYWNQRHSYQALGFEWYQNYRAFQLIIAKVLPKQGPTLHVGVGTSLVQLQMLEEGYELILNIDTSEVAVQRLVEEHKQHQEQLLYEVADVCDMPQYADSSFSSVLDKGTFDCLCCSAESFQKQQEQQQRQLDSKDQRFIEREDDEDSYDVDYEARPLRMLQECCRVLQPGAPLVMVSYGSPRMRVAQLLCKEASFGSVAFYAVGTSIHSKDVHVVGPFLDVEAGEEAADFDDVEGVVQVDYVYVASKRKESAGS